MNTNWNLLKSKEDVDAVLQRSHELPCLIFKHSTRCGISVGAKTRFESAYKIPESNLAIYYLDLLSYREVSNYIAEVTGVWHQSPQVILIKDGKAVYDESHHSIDAVKLESLIG